jgi:hypothetical protein
MALLQCVIMQNTALWRLSSGWFVRLEGHWLKGHANYLSGEFEMSPPQPEVLSAACPLRMWQQGRGTGCSSHPFPAPAGDFRERPTASVGLVGRVIRDRFRARFSALHIVHTVSFAKGPTGLWPESASELYRPSDHRRS